MPIDRCLSLRVQRVTWASDQSAIKNRQ